MASWESLLSGLIGAVIGGGITGIVTWWSVRETESNNKDAKDKSDKEIIKGLLQALHDELETIYERYQESMGSHLEAMQTGTALLLYYPIINDFFTVYNSNAFLIGRIDDNDLRKSLVRTYVLSKGLVDSFRMNNEMISRYEHWDLLAAETNKDIHKQVAHAHHEGLINYAAQLKSIHMQAKNSYTELMRRLHKRGVLHEL